MEDVEWAYRIHFKIFCSFRYGLNVTLIRTKLDGITRHGTDLLNTYNDIEQYLEHQSRLKRVNEITRFMQ